MEILVRAVILTCLMTLNISTFILGQTVPDPDLEKLITQLYVQGKLHGGILIAEGENIILQEAWGIADHEKEMVLTPDHRFNINSMGKMFTAILIMQLVEKDNISLDETLNDHLPEFEHPKAGEITIHHLLSHRSGLPDYFLKQLAGKLATGLNLTQIIDSVTYMELDFEPGTMFNYSNTGYILLARIVEKKYDQPYAKILQEKIFGPLGMNETELNTTVIGEGVPQYYSGEGEVSNTWVPIIIGEGGETSSLKDFHKFMLALGSEKLLTQESWELMFTPHSLPSEVPEGAWPPPHQHPYGYGFSLPRLPWQGEETALAVGHGGAGYGSNYAVKFRDNDRIVIVWNNLYKAPLLMEIFDYLAGRTNR